MAIKLVQWITAESYQETGGQYSLTDPAIAVPTLPLPSPWVTQAALDAALAGVFPAGGNLGQVLAIGQVAPRQLEWDTRDAVRTFTQADLSVAGIYPFLHGLGKIPNIEVFDSVGGRVFPDNVIVQGLDAVGVEMATYQPLSGVWQVKAS